MWKLHFTRVPYNKKVYRFPVRLSGWDSGRISLGDVMSHFSIRMLVLSDLIFSFQTKTIYELILIDKVSVTIQTKEPVSLVTIYLQFSRPDSGTLL